MLMILSLVGVPDSVNVAPRKRMQIRSAPNEGHRLGLNVADRLRLKGHMLNAQVFGNLAQGMQYLRPASKVFEAHMGGQGQPLGANRPDMQIVELPVPRNTG